MNIFYRKKERSRLPIPIHSRLTLIVFGLVVIVCVLPELAVRPALAQSTGLEAGAVTDYLDAAINWYHDVIAMDASAGSPSDALYLENARTEALQALRLAFQSAREEAALIQEQSPAPSQPTSEESTGQENISKAAADVAGRIEQTQSRMAILNRRLKAARGKKQRDLLDQRDAMQGELDLEKALQDALAKVSGFMSREENTGLAGKISTLESSVPDLASTAPAAKPLAQQVPKSGRAYASGLIGQASVLLSQIGDVRAIDALLSETTRLRDRAERLQGPLRDSLRGLLQEGRNAVNQPTATPQTSDIRQTLETITARFKQVSGAALPLRQEMIMLDQVRANLLEWHKSVEKEYGRVLRSLLTRVLVMVAALCVVVLFSEIWRRATYRYVREVRRRRQVLLLRRFVTGFVIAVVIILGVVSEFGSLATFAGFLTAGIAVALQTVILSVAAYFFLIGRYGVRVGDRITVSGVTGDVIDIGLVRMHLLELSGTGISLHPTGRVVVFSNSVLFQALPVFKQIPGTAYTWHEAVVTLSPGADHVLAEKKFLEVVNDVYAQYRPDIERQHGAVGRTIDAELPVPSPQGQLRFTDAGLEFVARYPVVIHRESEIDNQVVTGLVKVIESEPGLKAAVAGPPRLRSVIKG